MDNKSLEKPKNSVIKNLEASENIPSATNKRENKELKSEKVMNT